MAQYKDTNTGQIVEIPEAEVAHRARVQRTTYVPYVDPNIENIRGVFGSEWNPAPAFTSQLQQQGVYGAVRVGSSPDVYTLGPGGTKETPESYKQKFGTLSQEGIVGVVTPEQAAKLGIKLPVSAPAPIPAPAPVPPPIVAPTPAPKPTTSYENLVNVGGEIQEKSGSKAYSSPTELAGALGVQPNQIDWNKIVEQIDTEANAEAEKELSFISSEVGTKVDLSKSTELTEKIIGLLEDQTKQPQAPSFEQKILDERTKLGLTGLETDMAGIDAKIKQLDADYASSIEGEEQRQVGMTQIRRRQSAEEVAYNRAKRDLIVERDSIANQLNMKYAVLNTTMKYAGMDYDNAQQNYQTQLSNSLNLINLLRGVQEQEKTDIERKADNARANVQIMYNLFKEGNINYDQIDESTKLGIKNMEIQSGFPVGFTKFISETIDDPVVHFGSEFTDAAGNRIQPVTTVNKNTGNISVKNVNLGKGQRTSDTPSSYDEWTLAGGQAGTGKTYAEFIATKTGETEGEKGQKARQGIVAYFNAKKGKDGYVSPQDFKTARNAWAADGYSDDDFLKAFKNWANPDHYEDYDSSYF